MPLGAGPLDALQRLAFTGLRWEEDVEVELVAVPVGLLAALRSAVATQSCPRCRRRPARLLLVGSQNEGGAERGRLFLWRSLLLCRRRGRRALTCLLVAASQVRGGGGGGGAQCASALIGRRSVGRRLRRAVCLLEEEIALAALTGSGKLDCRLALSVATSTTIGHTIRMGRRERSRESPSASVPLRL